MTASRGSTVVQLSTLNPNIEGLNPGTVLVPLKHLTHLDRKSLIIKRLAEKM
jgi:hypothetical protein